MPIPKAIHKERRQGFSEVCLDAKAFVFRGWSDLFIKLCLSSTTQKFACAQRILQRAAFPFARWFLSIGTIIRL